MYLIPIVGNLQSLQNTDSINYLGFDVALINTLLGSLFITLIVTCYFCCRQHNIKTWRTNTWRPQWPIIGSLISFSWPVALLLLGVY